MIPFKVLADPVHIDNVPLINVTQATLAQLLSLSFTVIGAISVLFILIGAVRYAVATGDQGQLKQAKNTILYAIIGLVVSISAFGIVQFVLVGITK